MKDLEHWRSQLSYWFAVKREAQHNLRFWDHTAKNAPVTESDEKWRRELEDKLRRATEAIPICLRQISKILGRDE